MNEEQKLLDI